MGSRPSFNQPTSRPTISQPTARPTFSPSFTRTSTPSFTRTGTPSFSFTRTAQTSFTNSPTFSFTRTTQTSFTFSPTFTFTQTTMTSYGTTYTFYPGYWYPGMPFVHYGYGYSASTGSFTLGQTIYGPNNSPCLYYDYFEFNAIAGMTIQARLWTTGPPINYIVVPAALISLFQGGNGCSALGALTQTNTIGSTPYVYSWTAPQNGQYVVLFYATTPYTAPIYFLPA